jgi:Trk-type K+ transport system membrane component
MVRVSEVPQDSLLGRYVALGAYADCYVTELPAAVTHAQFVEAFYTTALFKLERLLLGLFLSRPSTDAQAKQLAEGKLSSFAAWSVESRAENQLILATGRTRSWLMVTVGSSAGPDRTQLFFGSAVVPPRSSSGARGGMGLVFTALLGFHKLYSRALLSSARSRLLGQVNKSTHAHPGNA